MDTYTLPGATIKTEEMLPPTMCSYKEEKDEEKLHAEDKYRERQTASLGICFHLELEEPGMDPMCDSQTQGFNFNMHGPSCPYNYTGKFLDESEIQRLYDDPIALARKIQDTSAYDSELYKKIDPRLVTKTTIIRDYGCKIPINIADTSQVAKAVLRSYPDRYVAFLNEFVSNLFGDAMKSFLKTQIRGYHAMKEKREVINQLAWAIVASVKGENKEDDTINADADWTELKKFIYSEGGGAMAAAKVDCAVLRIDTCINQHIQTLEEMHDTWCQGYATKEVFALVMMYYANDQGRRMCWDRRLTSSSEEPDYKKIVLHVPKGMEQKADPAGGTPINFREVVTHDSKMDPDMQSKLNSNLYGKARNLHKLETAVYEVGAWSGVSDVTSALYAKSSSPFSWGYGNPMNVSHISGQFRFYNENYNIKPVDSTTIAETTYIGFWTPANSGGDADREKTSKKTAQSEYETNLRTALLQRDPERPPGPSFRGASPNYVYGMMGSLTLAKQLEGRSEAGKLFNGATTATVAERDALILRATQHLSYIDANNIKTSRTALNDFFTYYLTNIVRFNVYTFDLFLQMLLLIVSRPLFSTTPASDEEVNDATEAIVLPAGQKINFKNDEGDLLIRILKAFEGKVMATTDEELKDGKNYLGWLPLYGDMFKKEMLGPGKTQAQYDKFIIEKKEFALGTLRRLRLLKGIWAGGIAPGPTTSSPTEQKANELDPECLHPDTYNLFICDSTMSHPIFNGGKCDKIIDNEKTVNKKRLQPYVVAGGVLNPNHERAKIPNLHFLRFPREGTLEGFVNLRDLKNNNTPRWSALSLEKDYTFHPYSEAPDEFDFVKGVDNDAHVYWSTHVLYMYLMFEHPILCTLILTAMAESFPAASINSRDLLKTILALPSGATFIGSANAYGTMKSRANKTAAEELRLEAYEVNDEVSRLGKDVKSYAVVFRYVYKHIKDYARIIQGLTLDTERRDITIVRNGGNTTVTAPGHTFNNGDTVWLSGITGGTTLLKLNGNKYTVAAVNNVGTDTASFNIMTAGGSVDTSGAAAPGTGGLAVKVNVAAGPFFEKVADLLTRMCIPDSIDIFKHINPNHKLYYALQNEDEDGLILKKSTFFTQRVFDMSDNPEKDKTKTVFLRFVTPLLRCFTLNELKKLGGMDMSVMLKQFKQDYIKKHEIYTGVSYRGNDTYRALTQGTHLDLNNQNRIGTVDPSKAYNGTVYSSDMTRLELFSMLDASGFLWKHRAFFNPADSNRPERDEHGSVEDVHPWCLKYMESFVAAREFYPHCWEDGVQFEPDEAFGTKRIGALCSASIKKLFPLVPEKHRMFDMIRRVRSLDVMWATLPTFTGNDPDKLTALPGAWIPLSEAHRVMLLKSVNLFDEKHKIPSNPWISRETGGLIHVYNQSYHSAYCMDNPRGPNYRAWVEQACRYVPPAYEACEKHYPFSQYGGTPVEADFLHHIVEQPDDDPYVKKRHAQIMYNRFGFTKPIRVGQQFEDTGLVQDLYSFKYRDQVYLTRHQRDHVNKTDFKVDSVAPSSFMAYARNHVIIALASCNHGTKQASETRTVRNLYRVFVDAYDTCSDSLTEAEVAPIPVGFVLATKRHRDDRAVHVYAGTLPCINAKLEQYCMSLNKKECEVWRQSYFNDACSLFMDMLEAARDVKHRDRNFKNVQHKKGAGYTKEQFLENYISIQNQFIKYLMTGMLELAVQQGEDITKLPLHLLQKKQIEVPVHAEDTDLIGNDFLGPRTLDVLKDLDIGENQKTLTRTDLAMLSLLPPNRRVWGALYHDPQKQVKVVDMDYLRKQVQKGVIEDNKKVINRHLLNMIRASLAAEHLKESGPIDFTLDETQFKSPLAESAKIERYMETMQDQSHNPLTTSLRSSLLRSQRGPSSVSDRNARDYEAALRHNRERVDRAYNKAGGRKSKIACLIELKDVPPYIRQRLNDEYKRSLA